MTSTDTDTDSELPGVQLADRVVGAVCVAMTVAALVLSYSNLVDFATRHGQGMPKALLFPLIIDSFVVFGEVRLYAATARDEGTWIKARMWLITIFGLAASMAGNWLRFGAVPVTWNLAAAAAPLAAAIGLGVGLGLVKLHARPQLSDAQDTPLEPEPEPRPVKARPAAASRRARRSAGRPDPELVALLRADRDDGKSLAWRQVVERHGTTQHKARTALAALGNGAG